MNGYYELFLSLIRSFLSGGIDASKFKAQYVGLWRERRDAKIPTGMSAMAERAFDRIFTACDCYCEDPTLRDPGDLDEKRFKEEVTNIDRELRR